MKKIFLFITILTVHAALAQQTGLVKPDLLVVSVSTLETKKDVTTGLHTVKVKVVIRNSGKGMAAASQLQAVVRGSGTTANATNANAAWVPFGNAVAMPALKAGGSLTRELTLQETTATVSAMPFDMRIIVDAGGTVSETNESNNSSTVFQAGGLTVAAPYTVEANLQIKKVDTLSIQIPAEAFTLSNASGNQTGSYYLITGQGGTMADPRNGIINNSLVAPVSLPVGAVICKVDFHYIKLSSSRSIPHLALVTRGLDGNNGGFIVRKNLIEYWISSPAATGGAGFAVKTSSTEKGFRFPITDQYQNSYYLEIKVDENAGRIFPQTSAWPNGASPFIWGVKLYYTLN